MPVKNICECHNPPGGSVKCEPHQLAICIVNNGVATKECKDPPSGMGNLSSLSPSATKRYLNWALSQITGKERQLSDQITSDDRIILTRGWYDNEVTGERITFSLPSELDLSPPTSASSSGSGGSWGTGSSGSSRNEPESAGVTATY